MTASGDLQPLTGDAASSPPAAEERIALVQPPPCLPPQQPEKAGRRVRFTNRLLDRLLMVGVVALAFLLASLPARNSDVWMDLATGRLLAHGQYRFGVDPFSFTSNGARWVNPSWLYDLLSFVLFQAGGGGVLVVAKAVLIALLGWILLRLSGPAENAEKGGNGWIATFFTVVALLIAGSALPLRPICVSYLFLALTIWLMESLSASDRPLPLASWGLVPLLFALWANMDAWFVLGPLTAALYLLGSLLAGRQQLGQARRLALLFVAGLAACLVNPHHYRIFALPPLFPFTAEAELLRDDPIFGRLMQSPFQRNFFRFHDVPYLGRLLYYPLVLLGLASFLLNGRGAARAACFRRLPVWLFFVTLSALDASTIPFMAIVTAPLTSLNIQQYLRRRKAMRSSALPPSPLWTIGGRIVSLAIIVGLLIAAWPGWLQGQRREPRGWFIETDTSLAAAVQQVVRWRNDGRLDAAETGFNFSPTAAHYFAWFAPEEKSFCDARWRPCAAAVGDYVSVRRALLDGTPDASVRQRSAATKVRDILRKHRVSYLVLHDSDALQTAAVFQRLATVPNEWPVLFLKGDTIIFGWRDPAQTEGPNRFADWRLDFHRRAFQPTEDELAPERGTIREPSPFDWRSFWRTAPSASSHARDEAALYLIYFDMLRPSFLARHRAVWEHSLAAAIVAAPGLSALPGQFLDFVVLQVGRQGSQARAEGGIRPLDVLAMRLMENYSLQQDDAPPGLLLLAVRAARRAVKENPYDAKAYHLLGEAYLHLLHSSRERYAKYDLPSLAHVRRIQAIGALHQSLLLQPDQLQPHNDLYVLYQDMGLLDLALQHAHQVVHLSRTGGNVSGERQEAWDERLRRMEQGVQQLEKNVQQRLNKYELQAAGRSVLEQAVLAREQGLGGKALDILLASDVAVFGRRGTEMELDLLLAAGRIEDAREWMAPGQGIDLSKDSYHRLRILLSAADGDYQTCSEELSQLADLLGQPLTVVFDSWKVNPVVRAQRAPSVEKSEAVLKIAPRQALALKVAQLLMEMPLQQQTILWLLTTQVEKAELQKSIQSISLNIRQQAELDVLGGALSLERGESSLAASFLRRALSVWGSESDAALGGGLDFNGRRTAQGLLEWLSPNKTNRNARNH